jgi:hypothetical protein
MAERRITSCRQRALAVPAMQGRTAAMNRHEDADAAHRPRPLGKVASCRRGRPYGRYSRYAGKTFTTSHLKSRSKPSLTATWRLARSVDISFS